MKDLNLPKIELKADLTKTVENSYEDTFKNPLKTSSDIVSTVLDFFHNTVLYPLQKYNLYAKDKLQNYASELENRAQSIPKKNLVNPRVNILGPAIEGLKYNLDEEYIKEMFTNILISDMNTEKQSKVLPSYIEIVKQLSRDDALILKFFKENLPLNAPIVNAPILKLKYENVKDHGFYYFHNNLALIYNSSDFFTLPAITIDNLLRLKIITIDFSKQLSTSKYEQVFQKIKASQNIQKDLENILKFTYFAGVLEITDFGKNFIDICLS